MAYESFNNSEIQSGRPTKQELFQKEKDNFDDHEDRISSLENSTATAVVVGQVIAFAGAAAPQGWLFCDGSAVSRLTYADLFAVIGTTYGIGDGSTTFNLPDARGRALFGKDDMGGVAASRLTSVLDGSILGNAGGAETVNNTHTHTIAGHTHTLDAHNHQWYKFNSSPTKHESYTNFGSEDDITSGSPGTSTAINSGGASALTTDYYTDQRTPSMSSEALITASGGNAATPNIPPALVVNVIIKT